MEVCGFYGLVVKPDQNIDDLQWLRLMLASNVLLKSQAWINLVGYETFILFLRVQIVK